MNPEHNAASRSPKNDLQAVEEDLQSLSRRIDRALRRHYATMGMCRPAAIDASF